MIFSVQRPFNLNHAGQPFQDSNSAMSLSRVEVAVRWCGRSCANKGIVRVARPFV